MVVFTQLRATLLCTVISCILFTFVLSHIWSLDAPGVDSQDHEAFHEKRDLFISMIDDETDDVWLPILRFGEIERILNMKSKVHGLADKFKIEFKNGYQALAKYVEPFSIVSPEWEVVTTQVGYLQESFYARRSGRKLQGWPEAAAGAVARVLGGDFKRRKVPCAVRAVSSTQLYGCEGCNSWLDWVGLLYPEHTVYLGLCAWMDRLVTTPPSAAVHKYLTIPSDPGIPGVKKTAGDISDTIVFDYLVDDHDRHAQHNWVSDGWGRLLLWDNGLSFNHGPEARDSCLDLLCGPDSWKDNGKKLFPELANSSRCKKICRFRNSTIELLRGFNDSPPGRKLGALVKEEIAKEGSPVFENNIYYVVSNRYPKKRYLADDFYRGLNNRLSTFLSHVSYCVNRYGEENVLVDM